MIRTNYQRLLFSFCLYCFLFLSCGKQPELLDSNELNIQTHDSTRVKVVVSEIQPKTFYRELISNGKLEAVKEVTLIFESQGFIEQLYVKNGQQVEKGALLCRLSMEENQTQQERNNIALEKAKLDMESFLLGHGYTLADSTQVPKHIWKVTGLQSGYFQAINEQKKLSQETKKREIRAPFSGVVADLKAKKGSHSSNSQSFCRIIDNRRLLVAFSVMESEMNFVQMGNSLVLNPYIDESKDYTAKVVEINPFIDENGLIAIKAEVQNKQHKLLTGMNVHLRVKKAVDQVIVVPKTSVVRRQNRHVAFCYKEGKALWNYVTIGDENASEYWIKEGLKTGDSLIVQNNLYLSHNEQVSLE